MPNFVDFSSPQSATALGSTRSLEALQRVAQTNGPCRQCGGPLGRYTGTGVCFRCTTGATDASEDGEMGAWYE
jgi:hypothetical protein